MLVAAGCAAPNAVQNLFAGTYGDVAQLDLPPGTWDILADRRKKPQGYSQLRIAADPQTQARFARAIEQLAA